MKAKTITEIGKLFIDLAKIIFAIAILSPLVNSGGFYFIALIPAILIVIVGIYLTNKGV